MPSLRGLPPTTEKVEALACALVSGDAGQIAVAADLLARLTEDPASARTVCSHARGEDLVARCLELAAHVDTSCDVRADVLVVLKNALTIPEGQSITCGHSLLRPILEAPPRDNIQERPQVSGPGDLSAVVQQAWLGLASSAVLSTGGGVLEGPRDLRYLQDAVFELCDSKRDMHTCIDGLLVLMHLYERRTPPVLTMEEASNLTRLMRWGLAEALECGDSLRMQQTAAISHTLHLLAAVGHLSAFRRAWFRVEDEDADSEQLDASKVQEVNRTIASLFAAVRSSPGEPVAWKAMSTIAEVKFVRRLMRVHPDVQAVLQCLLSRLEDAEVQLAEQAVLFLKQIFTGATDQFLSTETVMFDSMGRHDGITRLLDALIKSWHRSPKTTHRGNIVALLADAMFFSSFTDTWQTHVQASDLIGILFDALLCKGVEGTAGLALGNFVSANGHINLILDHKRASHSISNVGWFLRRTTPGWDSKMQVYYLWRVLRSRKGCLLLRRHPQASLVVAGLLKGVRHATTEDNEVLGLLEYFLKDADTRPVVLTGSNAAGLLDGLCELLSGHDQDLFEPSCCLLQALMEATGPGALLSWHGAPRLISALSRTPHGGDAIDQVISMLQWEPTLASSLSLEYKRKWISAQVRSGHAGDAVVLTVDRGNLLDGLCERFAHPEMLRRGVEVKFRGDGENGVGDGHRREFFRLVAAELMDPEFGLFRSNDGGRSFHPSSTSKDAQPECLSFFELCGKLIALALMHQETLPASRLTRALHKMILGAGPLEMLDMASVDPDFFKHKVLYIMDAKYLEGRTPMTLADLELVFEDAPQPDVFPDVRHELYPGGSLQPVTEDNKEHYVDLLCDHRMRGVVSEQVDALIGGLRSIIPEEVCQQLQRLVTPDELGLLICGLEEVDLVDWRNNTVMSEGVEHETWDQFWAVVESLLPEQRKELLEFVTASPGPPVGGFAALPGYGAIGSIQRFTLAPARNLQSSMPVAATCFNTLYLPRYESEEDMRAALLEAVAHRHVGGFHEGAVSQ